MEGVSKFNFFFNFCYMQYVIIQPKNRLYFLRLFKKIFSINFPVIFLSDVLDFILMCTPNQKKMLKKSLNFFHCLSSSITSQKFTLFAIQKLVGMLIFKYNFCKGYGLKFLGFFSAY